MSELKVNKWLNPDGTENFKCRAWVNFDGAGTVAIRDSFNVSSITDNGTGNYTVNFTDAMPDANYSLVATTIHGTPNSRIVTIDPGTVPTVSSARIATRVANNGSSVDPSIVCVSIHAN